MKAAIMYGKHQPLRVEEVTLEPPRQREVLVKMAASGVCHSDLHYVEGSYRIRMPAVLGHEAAGTVEAVGDQVTYVKAGDPVIMCLSVFCGHCEYCLRGQPHLCDRTDVVRTRDEPPRLSQNAEAITQMANLGGYAEMMLVHEHSLVKVRDDVPFDRLALIGCGATTGLGAALNTARVEPGSTVAVIGCGGVGLSAINGAALAGAGRIIVVDLSADRLKLATEHGATDTLVAGDDAVQRILDLTEGFGADYTFEATGLVGVMGQAVEAARMGWGLCTVLGVAGKGEQLSLIPRLLITGRRVQGGSFGGARGRTHVPQLVDMYLDGKIDLDSFVSHRLTLDEVNRGFELMEAQNGIRSVIRFD